MTEGTRLRDQLRRQLGFIERSCAAFDQGYAEEAIRIGTSLRVLLHNTRHSRSLLTLLGIEHIALLSTCPVIRLEEGATRVYFNGLASVHINGPNVQLRAGLNNREFHEEVDASAWWNEVVWIMDRKNITRRDIALAAANKDGGAHVDKTLTVEYSDLARPGAGGFFAFHDRPDIPPKPLLDAHFVSLRQMGYELLYSAAIRTLTHP